MMLRTSTPTVEATSAAADMAIASLKSQVVSVSWLKNLLRQSVEAETMIATATGSASDLDTVMVLNDCASKLAALETSANGCVSMLEVITQTDS
jgi:hypothetical protein